MALQYLRSLFFNTQMYVAMPVLAIVFTPLAIFSRKWAYRACHTYCAWVIWSARWIVGLKVDIRGVPPSCEVMVAAKHQSFFDILVIFHALPAAKFIMKRELVWAPILGQYALRMGCVPVSRGKRGHAIQKMLNDVASGLQHPGQLVIYPQGTRVAPGDHLPYKIGTGALYEQLSQDCVPVATNIGVFWPKRGILRKPGTAVVTFLPTISAGYKVDVFMQRLERDVEKASNALMLEAGFRGGVVVEDNPVD
ncbi:MAG: lysophospholipid acyltransferase family protein [Pseudomonadota bacterium]